MMEKGKTVLKATSLCHQEDNQYNFAIMTNLRMDTISWAWELKTGYYGEVRFFYVTPAAGITKPEVQICRTRFEIRR
jgi:hypothetical protein